jgi:hypothetical protein
VGAALLISALAFALGALCGEGWGPGTVAYGDLYLFAVLFGILGLAAILGKALWRVQGNAVTVPSTRVPPVSADSHEMATLIYEVAEKGLSSQASQMQDLRARAATLATVGPAAAAVIVAAGSAKFDLLAAGALVCLTLAVAMTGLALLPRSNFSTTIALEDDVSTGVNPVAFKVALAKVMNEARQANVSIYNWSELQFYGAAVLFLLAVLLWAIHAATGSQVLFALS